MKFLHAADLHLGAKQEEEQLAVLRTIMDLGLEHKVDFLLFAGDLFDSDHDADRLRTKVKSILDGYNLKVILLAGNHDAKSYSRMADYGDTALVPRLDVEIYQDLGELPLVCIPYKEGKKFSDYLPEIREIQQPFVLACHGTFYHWDWMNSLHQEKEEVGEYFPLYPEEFEQLPISYLALGHLHRGFYKSQHPVRHSGLPMVSCYPGSAFPRTIRETGPRKVAYVEVKNSEKVRVSELILKQAPYYVEKVLRCFPWREQEVIQELQNFLEGIEPHSMPVIVITGYTQNEVDLRQKLDKQLKDFKGSKLDMSKTKLYQSLMEIEFYKRYVEEIRKEMEKPVGSPPNDEHNLVLEKALEIFTDGFSKLLASRRR